MASDSKPPLPSRDQLLEFIRASETPVGRREIARAFSIKGPDRAWLRRELKSLRDEGLIGGDRRRATKPGHLPPVAVIEISHIDRDGDVICTPVKQDGDAPPPPIYLLPSRSVRAAPGIGDRALARLKRGQDGSYEARPIKILERAPETVIGLFRATDEGGIVQSIDRRTRHDLAVAKEHMADAQDRDYVIAQASAGPGRTARVIERLGAEDDPRITSLLVLKAKDVPMHFDLDAVSLAEEKTVPKLGNRTDFRDVPLITIDGIDARDYDDAVWAEPDPSSKNKGGWHILVAIADVAHYVGEGDALDRTARLRGNSVYCPDRVIPMLPEALSNGMCSLRPTETRACLAAEMWISAEGKLLECEFKRGLMRSAARLTYEQVQAAHDGKPDEATAPLLENVIRPLYGAFRSLDRARRRRGTLDLELPERRIEFDDAGRVTAITERERLDSHRLIEEFMIAANVAAARTLESKSAPVMYRIHEPPATEKIEALGEALDGLGLKLTKSGSITPALFAGILKQAADKNIAPLVSEIILRSQSQAVYSPARLGHFGLALRTYCHFTSPIRRYADILVHRALISALGLGKDGLSGDQARSFEAIGEEISTAERRAMTVEREVQDRLVTAFIADRVGATFEGRITGVTRHGLFVRLNDTGAEGLLPIRMLPDDWYEVDDAGFSMTGERFGLRFRLGEEISVELADASPITGSLSFRLISGGGKAPAGRNRARKPRQRRSRRR